MEILGHAGEILGHARVVSLVEGVGLSSGPALPGMKPCKKAGLDQVERAILDLGDEAVPLITAQSSGWNPRPYRTADQYSIAILRNLDTCAAFATSASMPHQFVT